MKRGDIVERSRNSMSVEIEPRSLAATRRVGLANIAGIVGSTLHRRLHHFVQVAGVRPRVRKAIFGRQE
jgi:hypothetical protein